MLLRLFGIQVRRTPRGYWIHAGVWAAWTAVWAISGTIAAAIATAGISAVYGAAALRATYRRSIRGQTRRLLYPPPEVTVDKHGIRLGFDDGSTGALSWDEIREVDLVSMRRPLLGTDLFILFRGPGDKALPILYDELPLNLLEEIHRLPGVDLDSPPQARVRLQRARGLIVCWRRDPTPDQPDAEPV